MRVNRVVASCAACLVVLAVLVASRVRCARLPPPAGGGRRSQIVALALAVIFVSGSAAVLAPAGAGSDEHGSASVERGPAAVQGALLPAPGSAGIGRELPDLRSRNSRAYVAADGGRVSRVFAGSVNFRDGRGEWRGIDNRLRPTSEGFSNGANRYRLELPKDLDEPVRVSHGEAWVEYRLEGAAAAGSAEGATARYRDALDGVDVAYSAAPDGVKETITLAGPESARVFRFALRTSPGLSAEVGPGRSIEIVGAEGKPRFSLVAPVMWDSSKRRAASGDIAVELDREGQRYSVELRPDSDWLDDARREWPVVVDPTVVVGGAMPDCGIGSFQRSSGSCASGYLPVEWLTADETKRIERRSLLKFDLGAVPRSATVLSARMGLYVDSSQYAPRVVEALAATKAWTAGVSWDLYDGANRWEQPGGDFSLEARSVNSGLGAPGWALWDSTEMVRRWVDQSRANNGVLLRDPTADEGSVSFRSSEHPDPASRPYLDVEWQPRTGDSRTGDYPQASFLGAAADRPLGSGGQRLERQPARRQ